MVPLVHQFYLVQTTLIVEGLSRLDEVLKAQRFLWMVMMKVPSHEQG
jgi:hypothetical protein